VNKETIYQEYEMNGMPPLKICEKCGNQFEDETGGLTRFCQKCAPRSSLKEKPRKGSTV